MRWLVATRPREGHYYIMRIHRQAAAALCMSQWATHRPGAAGKDGVASKDRHAVAHAHNVDEEQGRGERAAGEERCLFGLGWWVGVFGLGWWVGGFR